MHAETQHLIMIQGKEHFRTSARLKPCLGCLRPVHLRLNWHARLLRLARILKFGMKQVKLSRDRITKALISLCASAGWSAHLLFA